MRTRRQPKVHRYTKRRGRRATGPGRTLLSVCFTFVIAGAIGVVGYSIAKPILQFTGSEGSSGVSSEFASELVVPAETTVQTTGAFTETSMTETTAIEPETTPITEMALGVRIPETALADANALANALSTARQTVPDGTVLVIPLKVAGGAVLYQTSAELAKQCGAAQGTLTLSEIVTAVKAEGWIPVAECSLLYDNLLPDANAQAGYMIADGSSRWLDNKKENGGKPWVSPFSDVTVQYLTELVQEIAAGGFEQIWCTDLIFPTFRESDLTYLDAEVQDVNRGQTLVQLVNSLSDAARTVPVLLKADGESVMNGTDEAFDPDTLEVSGIVLDLGTQVQVQAMLDWIGVYAPELHPWLMADTSTVSGEMVQIGTEEQDVSGWILYDAEPLE